MGKDNNFRELRGPNLNLNGVVRESNKYPQLITLFPTILPNKSCSFAALLMSRKKYTFLILILGTLSAIGPFSIDMYLPGFPAMALDLKTTVSEVSLSLSSFFIGISVGQMLYGPLLDRYGRKKPLYFGLVLYILASVGCAFANSVNALIYLRFLQALGGCVGMVASRAMVRDLFPVKESARVFSLLMLVIGVSPMLAPTLGGYITDHLGWPYIFAILTVMAILILTGVHFILPESRQPDTSMSLKPRAILKNFHEVIIQNQFYTYTLTGSIAAAGLYAYISGSPYVFMEIFKVNAQQYGWIFASIAIGIIGASQLNSLLLHKMKSEKIIVMALACQSATGILLLLSTAFGFATLWSTIALIFLFLCCQGFTFPNTSALAMAPFSQKAGSASALMGAIQMGFGALTSMLVSVFSNHTAIPMAAAMAGCSVTSFCILMLGKRTIRYKARLSDVEEESADLISKF
ncbi:MAG TPA: multidrug effflux MFS transporter [Daejeonella sp.]|nr:multidrug effflux MFS transporter [Daejeonella sp.]